MRLDPPTMTTSSIAPAPADRADTEHPLDDLGGGVEQVAADRVQVAAADVTAAARAAVRTTTSA